MQLKLTDFLLVGPKISSEPVTTFFLSYGFLTHLSVRQIHALLE